MFRREESQQFLFHELSSSTPLQIRVKQALCDVSSARKNVALDVLLLCLGLT